MMKDRELVMSETVVVGAITLVSVLVADLSMRWPTHG